MANQKRSGNKKRTPEEVGQQASICLKDRENITSAPVWNMGKVYVFRNVDSFALMQNTIDYLDCKAQTGRVFTGDEKEFLIELYEAFWWGGKISGMKEAAQLANHYVHGDGKEVRLDSFIYENSLIVKDAIKSMKGYIAERHKAGKPIKNIKSTDMLFYKSKHAIPLQKSNRNQHTTGSILADGGLIAEQVNIKLHYTDNRFHLRSDTELLKGVFFTKWSVESLYDFEPYPTTNYTNIPIKADLKLKLPDGLSNHMEKIGIAKSFWHTADWHEHWQMP